MRFTILYSDRLRSDEHKKFYERFMEDVDKYPLIQEITPEKIERLRVLMLLEAKLTDAQYSSQYTPILARLDKKQDRILSSMKKVIEAGLNSSEPAIVTASERLLLRFKPFKKIKMKRYEGESGAVGILINDLRTDFIDEINLVGIINWLTDLEVVHEEFDLTTDARLVQWSERMKIKLKTLRKEMDALYKEIIEHFEGAITNSDTDDYDLFAEQLETLIKQYNSQSTHHERKNLSGANVDEIPTQIYTGQRITVVPTVYYAGTGEKAVRLFLGKDFSLTYFRNIKVGTAEVRILGKGLYIGKRIVTFNIEKEVLTTN